MTSLIESQMSDFRDCIYINHIYININLCSRRIPPETEKQSTPKCESVLLAVGRHKEKFWFKKST